MNKMMTCRLYPILLVTAFFLIGFEAINAHAVIHHDLQVTLNPASHHLAVRDTLHFLPSKTAQRLVSETEVPKPLIFTLDVGLTPQSLTDGVELLPLPEEFSETSVGVKRYQLRRPAHLKTVTIQYQGRLFYPLENRGKARARGQQVTRGMIGEEGVFLSGVTGWVPTFAEQMITFRLAVTLPTGWQVVSQGREEVGPAIKKQAAYPLQAEKIAPATNSVMTWVANHPQEEIYLIAAPFTRYEQPAGQVMAQAFLRTPDAALAQKYLAVTQGYLAMYSQLLGPYPYAKFALVENFWETGYGMPSFTLLGPTVIRLPFILHSSYPHEILHNWWGNSVYPDYQSGNWAEGLTAFLSDHLIKEQQGQGVAYRRASLQKYADYVNDRRDFPLTAFRSRHSGATEAIGYGKMMMVWHMLRRQLGDADFVRGLRQFYQTHQFKVAGFTEIEAAFSRVTGQTQILRAFFQQWVEQSGAPALALSHLQVSVRGGEAKQGKSSRAKVYTLQGVLTQEQPSTAYHLFVPVVVTLSGEKKAETFLIEMEEKKTAFQYHFTARPVRVDVDPDFDLFRRLACAETPPALSQLYGAEKMLIILPTAVTPNQLAHYQTLAQSVANSGPDQVTIQLDTAFKRLPTDQAVVVLGRANRFAPQMQTILAPQGVTWDAQQFQLAGRRLLWKDHAVVLSARQPKRPDLPLLWIEVDNLTAMARLTRKLPHYRKYSYLVFAGKNAINIRKGIWPVLDSPLTAYPMMASSSASARSGERVSPATSTATAATVALPEQAFQQTSIPLGQRPSRQPLAFFPTISPATGTAHE